MTSSTSQPVVGFTLYEGMTLLDFAGATQIFGFAGGYRCVWLSHSLAPVKTTEDVQVMPARTFDDPGPVDILFVPGGGPLGVTGAMFDPGFQAFLRQVGPRAQWVGSVCTGAFVLAASGLLDGCQATTYWSQLDNLRLLSDKLGLHVPAGFPRFVIDFEHHRFTGGGVSSSIDLALELVSITQGRDPAQFCQLSNQYAPDPPIRSGDPAQAPTEITRQALQAQTGFTAAMRSAVERLLVPQLAIKGK